MSNKIRSSNDEARRVKMRAFRHSGFVIRHSLDIGCFVIRHCVTVAELRREPWRLRVFAWQGLVLVLREAARTTGPVAKKGASDERLQCLLNATTRSARSRAVSDLPSTPSIIKQGCNPKSNFLYLH